MPRRGIDTAIETSGCASWEKVAKVCQHTKLIFYDIKDIDSERHKSYTGVTNKLTLDNIRRISSNFSSIPIIARTPVIPGLNDTEENIDAIASLLFEVESLRHYDLLVYHGFGETKYLQLGREYPLNGLKGPDSERMALCEKSQKRQ